jgi:hypothetical protein
VGPRAVLVVVVKRKIPSPRRESKPRTPFLQPVAESLYRLSYHGSLTSDVPDGNVSRVSVRTICVLFEILKPPNKELHLALSG